MPTPNPAPPVSRPQPAKAKILSQTSSATPGTPSPHRATLQASRAQGGAPLPAGNATTRKSLEALAGRAPPPPLHQSLPASLSFLPAGAGPAPQSLAPAPAPPPPVLPGLRAPSHVRPHPLRSAPRSVSALAAAAGPAQCFRKSESGPRPRSPAGQPWRQRREGGSIRERRVARPRSLAPPSCRLGGRAPAPGARQRPPRDAGRAAGTGLGKPRVGLGLPPESDYSARHSLCPGAWAASPQPFLFLGTPRDQAGSAAPASRAGLGQASDDTSLGVQEIRGGGGVPQVPGAHCPQRTCTPWAPPSSWGPSKRNRSWILVPVGRRASYPKNVRMEIRETVKCVEAPFLRKNDEGLFANVRLFPSLTKRKKLQVYVVETRRGRRSSETTFQSFPPFSLHPGPESIFGVPRAVEA